MAEAEAEAVARAAAVVVEVVVAGSMMACPFSSLALASTTARRPTAIPGLVAVGVVV